MAEEISEILKLLNEKLAGLFPYRLELVTPGELKLLDKNARYMKAEQFQSLVENVQERRQPFIPAPLLPGGGRQAPGPLRQPSDPWRPDRPG